MAGNPPQLVVEEMDASWIRDRPLSTLTLYALADTSEVPFTNVDPRGGEDWEVYLPTVASRICS